MNELKALAFAGGAWVIYVLMVASVLVVAVILDRAKKLWSEKKSASFLNERLPVLIAEGDMESSIRVCESQTGAASRILLSALRNRNAGVPSLEEHAAATQIHEKDILEKGLLILGTLGNNAPFIGLFGTVLGVIKAFHDLSLSNSGGPESVMSGISEALIATAVGLLVAIPSVIAYNFFQKQVLDIFNQTESLVRLLLAHLKDQQNHPVREFETAPR